MVSICGGCKQEMRLNYHVLNNSFIRNYHDLLL